MPYDPSLPLPNSPLESQVIRDQLQALFNLINNIVTVTAAQVDSVTTLPPGLPAGATVSVTGHTLSFGFELPQGPQGPPFSSAVVDAVNTVDPGTPAAVSLSFDGANVRFTFDIPKGDSGNDGGVGPQGIQGYQGPPGEVTNAQLDNAITGVLNASSNISNTVSALNQSADNSYNPAQMQDVLNKLDELIQTLRR